MQYINAAIKNYINQAQTALAQGDYKAACKNLAHAAESTMRLAKLSVGEERTKLLSNYKTLVSMLEAAAKKMEQQNAESTPASTTPVVDKVSDAVELKTNNADVNVARADNNVGERQDSQPKQSFDKGQDNRSKNVVQGKNDALSPLWLSDYIGQPQAVAAVKELITAARLKNSSLPHLIMYGSHGLGKTTFAKIIANEMRANFIELNVSKMTIQEMVAVFKRIKPKDIVFIDEIHTLPLPVAEAVLYSAMQDGRIVYTEGKGASAKTVTIDLPPFTLIGATTEIGKLAKPFTQRAILVYLVEYSDEVIAGIIAKSFYKVGMSISNENAMLVAKRSRNNPRIANGFVKRISDKALVRYAMQNNITQDASFNGVEDIRKLNIIVEENIITKFFEENNIDENGLEVNDRNLLRIIVERFKGGPVGLETLSKVMNEATNVLSEKYEAYLVKKGFMRIDKDGRVALAKAYTVLGLPIPPHKQETNDNQDGKDEQKGSRFEKRSVIVSKVPDQIKCDKIEELIVYPENAGIIDDELDDLFPDIQKPDYGDTEHKCELEMDFGEKVRQIECDSFLESRFARVMAQCGYIKDMKAQTVEFSYISQALNNKRYFPDFVIKDYKGRLAVIEMKNFAMASYHLNIDKYETLKKFCEEKGYGYSEIMKGYNAETYVSLDQIYKMPINEGLKSFILARIEQNGANMGESICFQKDIEEFFGGADKVDQLQVYTILLNDRTLKNVDRNGNDFRIQLT
ncbi:MAG: AAA family ATPase [Clostridia bacterium]|nr:AAA family ATPase [Clostridia bacterium]